MLRDNVRSPMPARALHAALLSATILTTCLMRPAEAARFGIVINQVQDPLLAGLSIPDTAPTIGMWSGVQNWPLNAISLGVLPNGKIASFGSPPDNAAVQNGRYYDIWDPLKGFAGGSHAMLQGVPFVNSFCAALAFQGDGSLMTAGGIFDGGTDKGAAVINPSASGLSALSAQLAADRYYSTMVTLTDGRKLIMGGSFPYQGGWADPQGSINNGLMTGMTPELYDGSRWNSLFAAKSRDAFGPDNNRFWYPRAWAAPNGKVFGISSDKMWFLDPTGNGSITAMNFKEPQRNAFSAGDAPNVGPSSTAVMYDTGKILQLGGNSLDNGTGFLASSRATIVDINGANPTVTDTNPTRFGRSWANATVLPTGTVAVNGGSLWDDQAGNNAVMQTELWDPKSGNWTLGPSAAIYRGYHSTAALMQNGAVITSGGGAPGPVNNQNTEIYYPPYLFATVNGKAALAPRAQILSLSTNRIDYGQSLQFEISSSTGVSQVVLVGLSLVTHSFNVGQRRYVAAFTQPDQQTVSVTAPASATIAPPGYYQLVAIDRNGVPSPGVIIGLGGVSPPSQMAAPVGVTQVAGTGGTGTSTGGTGTGGTGTGGTGTGVVPSAPTAAIRLESVSNPGNFARRLYGDMMSSAPVVTDVDRLESSFKFVNGLNGQGVSLQSTREPNRYVRHSSFTLYLSDVSAIGTSPDASFTRRAPLAQNCGCSGTCVSYESVNFPGFYVRTRDTGILGIDVMTDTPTYRQQASFCERSSQDSTGSGGTAPSAPTTAIRLESASNPGNFARRLYGDMMSSAPVVTDVDRLESSFKFVNGLNGQGVSLQSTREPNRYVRHSSFTLYLSDVSAIGTSPDASFTRRASLAQTCGCSGTCVSYESVNFPGFYVRTRDTGILGIDVMTDTPTYRQQASFCERQ